MTIKQVLKQASEKLKIKELKTPSLDAEVLLSFVLKKPKEFLYTYPEKKLTSRQTEKLEKLVGRRLKGEPIAYLTSHQEFYGLDFYVDKRVLIPRPETELLVEEVIKRTQEPKNPKTQVSIADVGTGSGCIIITLAKSLPETCSMKHATCYATDISLPALQIAKMNAKKHKVKIKFFQGDLLKPIKDQKIDLIVANLPYLDGGYKKSLKSSDKIGLKFEPKKAIFTKEGGLYPYRQLFMQLAERNQKPKLIFCEFDPRQKKDLLKMVRKYLPNYQARIKKDLAGLNLILVMNLTND